jgi:Uma2 family endonuclease
MASRTRIRKDMTLEEVLAIPEGVGNKRHLEYIDGRIEAKISPQTLHSLLTLRFLQYLNGWAEPARLGLSFPELRCTFAGRSIIPDVVFLLKARIAIDAKGRPLDEISRAPDIHIEIISPDRRVKKSRDKLAHSTSHGCALGWLIHPYRETIDVYRPGQPAERMSPDGVLEGEPVLPGFRLPVAEVFGWLVLGL